MKDWLKGHWEAVVCVVCGFAIGWTVWGLREKNDPELWLFLAIMAMALFLLWSGRQSSPRNQRRKAMIDDLFRQAQEEINKKGDTPPPPPPGRHKR